MNTIFVIFKLIFLIFSSIVERNKEKKKLKKEALKEVVDGIKSKDVSAITRGFDRAHRV